MTTGRAPRRPVPAPASAGPWAEKTAAIALQGGGTHGAFTWGVLDALPEDGRLAIEAITGASVGAMDAVVLVEGWLEGGPDGARARLEAFWRKVSLDGALPPAQRHLFDRLLGFQGEGGPGRAWLNLWQRVAPPCEANPLDINPLHDALHALIDFGRVRACRDARLFVAATGVWTGKIRVFEGPELAADHLPASACLPTLFRAVEIGGERGGYQATRPCSRSSTRRRRTTWSWSRSTPSSAAERRAPRAKSTTGRPGPPSTAPSRASCAPSGS